MASDTKMIFVKEAENTMAPVLLERYGAAAANQPATRAARTAVNNRRDFGTPGPRWLRANKFSPINRFSDRISQKRIHRRREDSGAFFLF